MLFALCPEHITPFLSHCHVYNCAGSAPSDLKSVKKTYQNFQKIIESFENLTWSDVGVLLLDDEFFIGLLRLFGDEFGYLEVNSPATIDDNFSS